MITLVRLKLTIGLLACGLATPALGQDKGPGEGDSLSPLRQALDAFMRTDYASWGYVYDQASTDGDGITNTRTVIYDPSGAPLYRTEQINGQPLTDEELAADRDRMKDARPTDHYSQMARLAGGRASIVDQQGDVWTYRITDLPEGVFTFGDDLDLSRWLEAEVKIRVDDRPVATEIRLTSPEPFSPRFLAKVKSLEVTSTYFVDPASMSVFRATTHVKARAKVVFNKVVVDLDNVYRSYHYDDQTATRSATAAN